MDYKLTHGALRPHSSVAAAAPPLRTGVDKVMREVVASGAVSYAVLCTPQAAVKRCDVHAACTACDSKQFWKPMKQFGDVQKYPNALKGFGASDWLRRPLQSRIAPA